MIKKVSTMLIILLSISATIILILVIALWNYSPGKPLPFLNNNGKPLPNSISEKIFINIGGVNQGMFIKSKNTENPVLLYIHGGIPDYFLTENYPTGFEEYFATEYTTTPYLTPWQKSILRQFMHHSKDFIHLKNRRTVLCLKSLKRWKK